MSYCSDSLRLSDELPALGYEWPERSVPDFLVLLHESTGTT
ncbi:unnamed protein product [Penicillium roqueforti FM164]|uniref:Uncharacterized protein n=1 Tax=Penicillium roqueforti (strain FM164) TaxID=1365484 RepID=W6QHX8_PENRF|nr:unnamed protein product [Penicillium roqueforti FM164]